MQGILLRRPLLFGKWLAAHHRVDGIKDPQAIDIRHTVNGDRIADIQNLAIRIGERRPLRKTPTVRISRLREVDPVAGHLLGHSPVRLAPAPGLLVQMVEHIPEFGEVARAPTCVDGTGREWWLLSKIIVIDGTLPCCGLQPRPGPHVPAEAEVAFEAELRLPRLFVGSVGIGGYKLRRESTDALLQVFIERTTSRCFLVPTAGST